MKTEHSPAAAHNGPPLVVRQGPREVMSDTGLEVEREQNQGYDGAELEGQGISSLAPIFRVISLPLLSPLSLFLVDDCPLSSSVLSPHRPTDTCPKWPCPFSCVPQEQDLARPQGLTF